MLNYIWLTVPLRRNRMIKNEYVQYTQNFVENNSKRQMRIYKFLLQIKINAIKKMLPGNQNVLFLFLLFDYWRPFLVGFLPHFENGNHPIPHTSFISIPFDSFVSIYLFNTIDHKPRALKPQHTLSETGTSSRLIVYAFTILFDYNIYLYPLLTKWMNHWQVHVQSTHHSSWIRLLLLSFLVEFKMFSKRDVMK